MNQVNEAIEPDTPIDQLRQEPYSLPGGFNWDTLNLDDPLIVSQSLIAAVFTWDDAVWLIARQLMGVCVCSFASAKCCFGFQLM